MTSRPLNTVLQQLRAASERDGAGSTDGELLTRFLSQRDEAALAALVERHAPMVWGVCRRVLRNPHDAEDAFQATFLVLVRKAGTVVPREMVANWLYGVAQQTAVRLKATAAKRGVREMQLKEMPEPVVAETRVSELLPFLDQELSRLPEHHRVLIVLCDLEGKTRKEAARQLGCPEGTVASRLARARDMLAKRMARHGLAVSGGSLAAALSQSGASAGVPDSVVSSTIHVATLLAANQAEGVISGSVAALTEGVLKTMFLKKIMTTTMVVLALSVAVITGGSLAIGQTGGTGKPVAVKEVKQPAAEKPVEPAVKELLKQFGDKLAASWTTRSGWREGGGERCHVYVLTDGTVVAAGDSYRNRECRIVLSPKELAELLKAFDDPDDLAALAPAGTLYHAEPNAERMGCVWYYMRRGTKSIQVGLGSAFHVNDTRGALVDKIFGGLPRLVHLARAGGSEELARLLPAANAALKGAFPDAPELRAEDFTSSERFLYPARSIQFDRRKDGIKFGVWLERRDDGKVLPISAWKGDEKRDLEKAPTVRGLDLGKVPFTTQWKEIEKLRVLGPGGYSYKPEYPSCEIAPEIWLCHLPKEGKCFIEHSNNQRRRLYGPILGDPRALLNPPPDLPKAEAPVEKVKEPFTAWGKEVGGLQAGFCITNGDDIHVGGRIKAVVKLRNVSKETISASAVPLWVLMSPTKVVDSQGKPVRTTDGPYPLLDFNPKKLTLKPSEAVDVDKTEIPVAELNQEVKVTAGKVADRRIIHVEPGKYKVNWTASFVQEHGELATGIAEFEVKAAKEPFTAWGKEVGGLQAGLGFKAGEKRAYSHGESVTLVVRVRNVGMKDVNFEYHSEHFVEKSPNVIDADAKPVRQHGIDTGGLIPLTTKLRFERVNLAPDREYDLGEVNLKLRPASEGVAHPSPAALYGTGKVSVHYERLFLNTAMGGPRNDPDLSKLATGKLELEVTETPPAADKQVDVPVPPKPEAKKVCTPDEVMREKHDAAATRTVEFKVVAIAKPTEIKQTTDKDSPWVIGHSPEDVSLLPHLPKKFQEEQFSAVLTAKVVAQLKRIGIKDVGKHFEGKTIRISGRVVRNIYWTPEVEPHYDLVIDDLSQLEAVE